MCCDIGTGQGSLSRLHLSRNGSTGNILYHEGFYNGACKNALLDPTLGTAQSFLEDYKEAHIHGEMLLKYQVRSVIDETYLVSESGLSRKCKVKSMLTKAGIVSRMKLPSKQRNQTVLFASFHMTSLKFKLQNY